MKNLIKIIIFSIVGAGIISIPMQANPGLVSKLLSYAVKNYGFNIQYPVLLKPWSSRAPTYCYAQAEVHETPEGLKIKPGSKEIVFVERYFEKKVQKNDFKSLLAQAIHEQTHHDKDHILSRWLTHNKFMNNENVTINGTLWTPQQYEDAMNFFYRLQEEEADAGLKQFPDLCLHRYHHYIEEAKKEVNDIQRLLLLEEDLDKRSKLKTKLAILGSNNPELIKTTEDTTHPCDARRALYLKQWATDGALKNIQEWGIWV